MIAAIQQPEHLPWLGFFDKMRRCDTYIFLDNVQFKKRYFENRNKIRIRDGWQWISVPVITKGRYTQKIHEVMIDNSSKWKRSHLGSLQSAYAKTPHFREIFPALETIIGADHTHLSELNITLINYLGERAGINTPCIKASDLIRSEVTGSELILKLCLEAGADTYLSGPDGRNYLDLEHFREKGISVIYHEYDHPVYFQIHGGEFRSHMSAIDYFFNHGFEAV